MPDFIHKSYLIHKAAKMENYIYGFVYTFVYMNGKETRKLVQQNETLTISIPIWWARYYNLKAGDSLDLVIQNNKITIMANKE